MRNERIVIKISATFVNFLGCVCREMKIEYGQLHHPFSNHTITFQISFDQASTIEIIF